MSSIGKGSIVGKSGDRSGAFEQLMPLLTRVFVWGLIFAALYILRSFFLLIFLTFVFSYIQSHATNRLSPYLRSRTLRVILVAIVFLGILVGIGSFSVPRIKEQAAVFASQYSSYLKRMDEELVRMSDDYPVLNQVLPDVTVLRTESVNAIPWSITHSPSARFLQQIFGFGEVAQGEEQVRETLHTLRNIGSGLLGGISAFLLALLFSFLIVLDLPRLAIGVQSLAKTKVGFIYDEVAENIHSFGQVVGRALQAQLFIAILNMILTAIGIYLIGIRENMMFVSLIVFLCSFIPVAGVFMSSLPICLMALQQQGIAMMIFTILLIWVIHLIETYVLNPKIYGHHLHINPVLVLIILTIGGKLFGVWGLVLGLPVCRYIFGHAIQYRKPVAG